MATTKVFRSGNSQAVRIPKEFQFDTGEVEILRRDDEVILRKPRKSLADLFDVLSAFSDDMFAEGRNQPRMQKRRAL